MHALPVHVARDNLEIARKNHEGGGGHGRVLVEPAPGDGKTAERGNPAVVLKDQLKHINVNGAEHVLQRPDVEVVQNVLTRTEVLLRRRAGDLAGSLAGALRSAGDLRVGELEALLEFGLGGEEELVERGEVLLAEVVEGHEPRGVLEVAEHLAVARLGDGVQEVEVAELAQVGAPQVLRDGARRRGAGAGARLGELHGEALEEPVELPDVGSQVAVQPRLEDEKVHGDAADAEQRLAGLAGVGRAVVREELADAVLQADAGLEHLGDGGLDVVVVALAPVGLDEHVDLAVGGGGDAAAPDEGREAGALVEGALEAGQAVGGQLDLGAEALDVGLLVGDDGGPHAEVDFVAHLVVDLVELVGELVAVELAQLVADEAVVEYDVSEVVELLGHVRAVVLEGATARGVCAHSFKALQLPDAVDDVAGLVGQHLLVLALDELEEPPEALELERLDLGDVAGDGDVVLFELGDPGEQDAGQAVLELGRVDSAIELRAAVEVLILDQVAESADQRLGGARFGLVVLFQLLDVGDLGVEGGAEDRLAVDFDVDLARDASYSEGAREHRVFFARLCLLQGCDSVPGDDDEVLYSDDAVGLVVDAHDPGEVVAPCAYVGKGVGHHVAVLVGQVHVDFVEQAVLLQVSQGVLSTSVCFFSPVLVGQSD
ncbi:oligopeptide transport ATP-binding protein, putative [Babesia caballi]|uniref:Oligopeptide transport ATP-binding protein, putative n=1 Tax=Babesia caballi TaxID=5871 RepID=A0AAV4LUB1_BABCB|nr:oligopeptide transport ATP-binding protein, putative [Babesia caballi]